MKTPLQRKSFYRWKHLDPSGAQGVYYESAFRFMLWRERSRTDRAEGLFSLAIFHLKHRRNGKQEVPLLDVLAGRIRISDTIGWLNRSSLSVLLPDTPAEGAETFVQQVKEELPDVESFEVEIRSYPKDIGANDLFGAEETHQEVAPDTGNEPLMKSETALNDALATYPHPICWAIERLAATLCLLLLSPLFLIIALTIKFSSPGPVFFKQERVGHKGRVFSCYKFRTMRMHAETEKHEEYLNYLMTTEVPMQKLDCNGDDRIFPAGRFLRASSLDELPQLINIVRGEMRLIGPRPCTPHEYEKYQPWHRHRTDALPGLTGLWQVCGKNRTTFHQMIGLDLQYIRTHSLWLDFCIILKTFPVLISLFMEDRRSAKSTVAESQSSAPLHIKSLYPFKHK